VHTAEVDIAGTTTWVRTDEGWHPGTPPADRIAGAVWVRVAAPDELLTVAEALGLPFDPQLHRAAAHAPGRVTKPHVDHLDGGGLLLVAPTISYRDHTADVLSGEVVCLVLD